MNIFLNIILIVLAVLAQITIAAKISIFSAMINIPMIIITSLILAKRFDLAKIWMFSGLLLDLLSPTKFGFYTVTFIILYLIINLIIKKIFYKTEFYIVILFFMIGSFIIDIPFLTINFSTTIIIGNMIYNTIIGCIVYWFIKFYLEPQSILKIKI